MARFIDLPEYLLPEETEKISVNNKGLISLTGIEKFRDFKNFIVMIIHYLKGISIKL